MASFHSKSFTKHDDYMTPASAWINIEKYLPKDKVIWEAFYGDGTSGKILEDLGCTVIHEDYDFFENNLGDVVVTNPAFTLIPETLQQLVDLDKPFIMIMPSSKINTQYFRKIFACNKDPIQIIVPRKRIQFLKMIDGVVDPNQKRACNFDCFYYCWKMNLPRDIIWLSDEECVEMKKKKK